MDSLIRQMGVRYCNVGKKNPEESSRQIPLQKTQSFKGEKRRGQNWLRRQFSRQMSGEFDPNNQMERATAVAAAVYAINKSLEESRIPDQRKTSGVPPQPSLSRQRSKKEDTPIPITEPGRVSKRFSGENTTPILVSPDREIGATAAKDEKALEKAIDPPQIKKTITFADEISKKGPETTKPERTPSEVIDPGPSSMKKRPIFTDEGLNRTSSRKPEGAAPKIDLPNTRPGRTQSKPDTPPPIEPATSPTETKRHRSTRPVTTETQADAWEKAKMAKIKEKYEKLNQTILSWEERKKKKAGRKLEKARRKLDKADQSELKKRSFKALQKFHSDMETIDQIAGGARAQAQEKRRNEELKVKEKAYIIRTTGKLPATKCCCF